MMLGPAMSTRSEVTERVTTIPKTHPLANSIAPGGSQLTVPPSPRRGAPRWQIALGAVALLGLGGGAAAFLQSRGEHHAASSARAWDEEGADDEAAERREEHERKVLVEPMTETMVIIEDAPEPVLLEGPAQPGERALSATLAATLAAESEAESELMVHQDEPEGEPRARRDTAAPREPSRADVAGEPEQRAQGLQITVGSVQLRTREDSEPEPMDDEGARPQRAQVIEAMNTIASELRACVGDEHGIADVTLTVRGSGTVSHALVEGPFAGSAKGSCIARSLRAARLPRFADPLLRITYPLQL